MLTIYKQFFETPFLEDTERFYKLEAEKCLNHHPGSEYLKKVAQWLDEEVHRVQSYLHSSTLQPLIKKVEDLLIRNQLEMIYEEAKTLLRGERHQGESF
jgi:cullin 1